MIYQEQQINAIKGVKKELHDISESLRDIRGMMMDLAPRKKLGADGEVESVSYGFTEEVIRRIANDGKKNVAKEKLGETLEYIRRQITFTEAKDPDMSFPRMGLAISTVNDLLKRIESDLEAVMEEL